MIKRLSSAFQIYAIRLGSSDFQVQHPSESLTATQPRNNMKISTFKDDPQR